MVTPRSSSAFASSSARQGLKSTRQRDDIARWFFDHKGHISADRIYREVKRASPGIGFSTVYRTMKLLCEAGLVHERHFGDGEALYENVSDHHDHCICTQCGRIIEFENPQIEALQERRRPRFRASSSRATRWRSTVSAQRCARKPAR